ncbi:MAG: hypothetical protein ACLP1X_06285 [Polyangiaceae bacterium]
MRRDTIIACLAWSFVGLAAAPGCSSTSGGAGGFPEGGSGGSSGGSSSSTTGSSSSGSGTSSGTSTSSSGSGSSASSSGSGTSSGIADSSPPQFTDGGTPLCNETPCDLQSNTCCVTQFITGSSCIEHSGSANQGCPANTAAFSCLQASDCTTAGQVCCGEADSTAQTAGTSCKTVAAGGSPCGASSSTAAYAQICTTTKECKNGMQCVAQVCAVVISGVTANAHLTMCGLQTQAPFNCTQ